MILVGGDDKLKDNGDDVSSIFSMETVVDKFAVLGPLNNFLNLTILHDIFLLGIYGSSTQLFTIF